MSSGLVGNLLVQIEELDADLVGTLLGHEVLNTELLQQFLSIAIRELFSGVGALLDLNTSNSILCIDLIEHDRISIGQVLGSLLGNLIQIVVALERNGLATAQTNGSSGTQSITQSLLLDGVGDSAAISKLANYLK